MIRFGEFLFDAEARELRRGGKPVHVSPKAFRLLELLIGNAPKAVSKASLYESLWPSVFVEESNLKSLVSEVRAAIGEDARSPRFLKTVYGFGYAFRFDASASVARFRVTHLARDFELLPGENVLGRDDDVSVVISMKSISRRHARIVVSGDTVDARGPRQQERHLVEGPAGRGASGAGRRGRDPAGLGAPRLPRGPRRFDGDRHRGVRDRLAPAFTGAPRQTVASSSWRATSGGRSSEFR